MKKILCLIFFALALIMCSSPLVWAGEGSIDTGDNAWILASAALVLLMTPGLCLFYGGLSSVKNIVNMLMMCFICIAIISLQWIFWGYSLSFSGDGWFIGNLSKVGLMGITPSTVSDIASTIPEGTFMIFQCMFAVITPALVLGAVEGRMKFSAVMIFVPLFATAVYNPVCHWQWGGGWMGNWGILDYAGGLVVHVCCGAGALTLAIMLGARKRENARPPCNLPMVCLGTGLLWFGWFGFNGGSALASDGRATFAFISTNTAAATGALVWIICEWIKTGKPTLLGALTGAIAGLATITPASGFVGPLAAVQIGIMAGIGCFFAVTKLKSLFHFDDALDVVGVHAIGGTIGTFAAGLYSTKMIDPAAINGFFIGWDMEGLNLLGKQCVGILATWAYTVAVCIIIALIVKYTVGLRTTETQEDTGLDITLHGETSYHLETEPLSSIK
ncbi:MAG: ammonium transporter [Candidatus Scalindua sp. AMX11]|nr:MAG: ammonium transporter [Candidatus Scalindua sp.]NOG83286.1 ammonium transporter [Planctomycetota bacterium]RZV71953.1 MAG: ammonium transporter [Candidatus Scalindua sp. SCAELEC01]TDE63609.1 MAG: ammonium transporter [Candidatus Scalindua sp. AMX11]GJQ60056.1 MAG: ammonium transporter [Candidatus Scalindua sp.]